jgi:hypothetical protein
LVFIEWALIAFFSILLLMLAVDLPNAWYAEPCWPHAGEGCYPWGGEGPVATSWNYASKRNYLASSIFGVLATSGILFGALMVSRGQRIFVLLAGIALLYLGNILLPGVI